MPGHDTVAPFTTTVTTTTTTTTTTAGAPAANNGAAAAGNGGAAAAPPLIAARDPNTGLIPANDADYPPYLLTFKGKNTQPVQIGGPHTDSLRIGDPDTNILLELKHQDTADGPNLIVQITRIP